MPGLFLIPAGPLILFIAGVMGGLMVPLDFCEMLAILTSAETRFALSLTRMTSGAATAVGVFLGVPAGHFLARRNFPGKLVVDTLIDLPMTMTPLVAGVGLLFLLGSDSVRAVLVLGIQVLFSPLGAVLAQVFIVSPIVTWTSRAAFAAIDMRYEQAAQTLCLSPIQMFSRITCPWPGRCCSAGQCSAGPGLWENSGPR